MECGILVTVNDLWPPIPYMECGNLGTGSPHMYDMIFSGQLHKRSTACPNQIVLDDITKYFTIDNKLTIRYNISYVCVIQYKGDKCDQIHIQLII